MNEPLPKRTLSAIVRGIWSDTCCGCGRRGSWVCERCRPTVQRLGTPACLRCGAMDLALCDCAELASELQSIRAAYPHIGWVRSAIHQFKFNGEFSRDRHLALELVPLADYIAHDVVIPVPMHREREHLRGYNQAALLARQLSILSGIPVDGETLIRPIKRAPQVGRDRLERRKAISGVFSIDLSAPMAVHSKRVLVVDDVITTGATVSECARVLGGAGAASVSAISIARG